MIFCSHLAPEKALFDHLQEVVQYSQAYGDMQLAKLHAIIGYAHDFGKYTTFFQDRLYGRKDWGEYSHHGYLSALFGVFVWKSLLDNDNFEIPLCIFSTILSHHGDLKPFSSKEYLPASFRKIEPFETVGLKIKILEEQRRNMVQHLDVIARDYEKIGWDHIVRGFLTQKESFQDILCFLRDKVDDFKFEGDEKAYFIHHLLYSSLLAADKMSAARIVPVQDRKLSFESLALQKENMLKRRKPGNLDTIRKQIFDQVQAKVAEVYNQGKFFSITSPTGTGKTLTGFFAVKKLQELLGGMHKIIYALPFTSIIDQNYRVIADLHTDFQDFKNHENLYLLKHHHLSNAEYKNEAEDYRRDQAELLVENWDSGIVVTTFVQLLQTMIGQRNRMLKKYHVLSKSIILLDEVQAIPVEYYSLVNYVFDKMTALYDCRIILMTATKPIFFDKTIELLDHHEYYFRQLNRTCLRPNLTKITVEEFCNIFGEKWAAEKSYLIVANTINQSLEIYQRIKNQLGQDKLYYLSTNIIPLQRRSVLNEVENRLKAGEKIILVATQVVEAGVDVDFDIVVRDIAPVDSIIQCAGRCNRNAGDNCGLVQVVWMTDHNDKSFGSKIYGSSMIQAARTALESLGEVIPESKYGQLVNLYYEKIKTKISADQSDMLIEAIKTMDFDSEKGVGMFSLIDDQREYIDLFVEWDENAGLLLAQIEDILKLNDNVQRRNKLKDIGRKMRQYIISVPGSFAVRHQSRLIGCQTLYILDQGNVEHYYDPITGLKRNDEFDMYCY